MRGWASLNLVVALSQSSKRKCMDRGVVFIDDDPDDDDPTPVNRRWTMELKSQAVSTEIAGAELYVSQLILDAFGK